MSTAGLVLAAGAGRRFGGPKALARLGGELLTDRAVRLLREGGCRPVLAVVGADAERVQQQSAAADVEWVVAAGWAEGMSASLRAGLAAAQTTGASALCVVLVDQPQLSAAAVRRVVAAVAEPGVVAAQARYDGRPGHPVAFARSCWDELAGSLRGDRGARDWLAEHAGQVRAVDCDGLGSDRDVDRPGDLAPPGNSAEANGSG